MSATQSDGDSSQNTSNVSFADQMRLRHADDHLPTVEDAVDQDDIEHPPPSQTHQSEAASTSVKVEQPLSEKAQGKQKARDGANNGQNLPKSSSGFDTKSEELFPALGSAPRASAAATSWGTKKPSAVMNGASQPKSAMPASSIPAARSAGGAPQGVSIPGRHTQTVTFSKGQIASREQLKKPIDHIVRDISKRSRGVVISQKPSTTGGIVFEGKGPADAVQKALRELAREIGSRQNVTIPIPASVRPHIIGRQGATIKAIQERTGANVRVPKAEDNVQATDDDDSATVDVLVEGDAVSAEMARQEIEAIVNERTSTVSMRLKEIPAEFYPFIAGPHNASIDALQGGNDVQIKVPPYYSWVNQPPQRASTPNGPIQFNTHPTSHVQLSGERRAVQEVRAQIERQVEALRRQITMGEVSVPRGQHQFIVGEGGKELHDLLSETGCAVILPPDSDDSETIIVTGPPDKIDLGLEKVMDLASNMSMQAVDIARQHNNAPLGAQTHARHVTRYLQERQAIAQLEKLFDSRIVLPTSSAPPTWEVYSRDGKNTLRARSDIINVINAHPPSRFMPVEMDPFYHQYIREQHARRIRNDHGVHLLLPDTEDESGPIMLVYEGPLSESNDFVIPRQRPTSSEVSQFEQALRNAQQELLGLTSNHSSIGSRSVESPYKFHDKLNKFVRRDQQGLSEGAIPLQLLLGAHNTSSSDPKLRQYQARGPSDRLDDFVERIAAFLEAEQRDELERGFTLSFDFPQKYANLLIGRKGETINKLRDECDVDIQVADGSVTLTGPRAKAEQAKSKILTLAKKWDDEATHTLKIKPQYHRELIGAKGSQVNRLQTRYNVRVQFPRSAQSGHDDDSVVDGGEPGGPKHHRSNQAADEVVIRGPKKGADEARDEILSLLQYNMDNSHTASVSVAQNQLPSLIGQGGREMESLREQTGAKIDVPGSREAADTSGRVELKIRGTKKQVEDAKSLLEQRAKVFDDSVSRSIQVDKKHHKALIGGGGTNIRNIVVQAGGSDDRRELARTVKFPSAESDDTTVGVNGNKAVVDKIVAAIEAFVNERGNQTSELVEVAPEKHRQLIGHGGEIRRQIESQFGIGLDIPKQTVQGAARSRVKLTGPSEKIAAAKTHILELVKDQEGETINVPRSLHHSISDNGQFFRRLKNDHHVTVDHAGNKVPAKPSSAPRSRNTNGAALPLITDQEDSIDNHSWEIVDASASTETGEIPWVLRGAPENVAKARAILEKALAQSQQQSSTGYLILPDPSLYRHVIGPGGSQINAIRKQTGCKITVPRNQEPGEAIELVGSRDGVEAAKDIILEIVQNKA